MRRISLTAAEAAASDSPGRTEWLECWVVGCGNEEEVISGVVGIPGEKNRMSRGLAPAMIWWDDPPRSSSPANVSIMLFQQKQTKVR